MAQMEHEIEVGIDPEPAKKERKKSKSSKTKEKDGKVRLDEKNVTDKLKSETKTAVVEPTVIEAAETKGVKFKEHQTQKSPSPEPVRTVSPVKIHPLTRRTTTDNPINFVSPKPKTSIQKSSSPVLEIGESPLKPKSRTPSPNPLQQRRSPTRRIVRKSKSPTNQRSISPRSPIRRGLASSSIRKSPRKSSPDERSPSRRSTERYYSRNKSPSPYYISRDKDYVSSNRSRSPVRRRSLSPRKGPREHSPSYYKRRSRSPWSPVWRPSSPRRSPVPRYRSRSPLRQRSLSPRNRKHTMANYTCSPPWGSPKRRSPSLSPRRSKSPKKRDYSPRRPQAPHKREYYRRSSTSPKRKPSPSFKKYASTHSPKHKVRSPSPRRNVSPRRRPSPAAVKESRSRPERRSRTPSLSLSPSPHREAKDNMQRYKSPLRPPKESVENTTNRTSRSRRGYSPKNKLNMEDSKERRKLNSKAWERDKEGRHWEKKGEDRLKERADKPDRDSRRERESNKVEKQIQEETKEEPAILKVSENPVFEARRKKFESMAVVAPASKKIRLVNKKDSPVEEKPVEKKKVDVVKETNIVETIQNEDDQFSGHEEIFDIDNFLNEDVLDLSAEMWSSDDELFPKVNKVKKASTTEKSSKSSFKQPAVKEKISVKVKSHKSSSDVNANPSDKRTAKVKSKLSSPLRAKQPSPVKTNETEQEDERRDRADSDLRAELSRRREERLTKAGSLHETLPARLLQSAFKSALGTKTSKREKAQKTEKDSKIKEAVSAPTPKEKSDGRRVLVLKRPAPVRMQSAHINVTFPKDGSESDSSYSSSSSDDRYHAARKLPVYMRLGTAQRKRSSGRKIKVHSRRSQV